jgi:putative spermidine/putrescine transport system ATP-binding protein
MTIELRDITKKFGPVSALDSVNLTVAKGQFLTLLGPTGCGKTTLLRILAGFARPTSGQVVMDGQVINDVPPNRRHIGLLFQNYALFPHMTVAQNVRYGLRVRGLSGATISSKLDQVLPMVGIDHLRDRYPSQISGGQQQRTALARTLAIEPRVLLLDEPLAALDRRLRLEMQVELKKLITRLGITTICVSHDQDEALSMSDNIALMNSGKVEQFGAPLELYDHPRSPFAASFLGNSNLLTGQLGREVDGSSIFISGALCLSLPSAPVREKATLLLRPEHLRIFPEDSSGGLAGTISFVTHFGYSMHYEVKLDAGPAFLVSVPRGREMLPLPAGARVCIAPDSPAAYQLIYD